MKIPELHARPEERVGLILCPPEWFSCDPDLRIELLSDWIYGLERIRDATAVQMNADNAIKKAMKK